jgi:hypothetical protein
MIVHADVSAAARWVALVILLVVVQIGAMGAIAAYAGDRDWTSRKLQRFRGWMVAHNRVISILLGLVIGVLFIVKGSRRSRNAGDRGRCRAIRSANREAPCKDRTSCSSMWTIWALGS